MNKNDINIDKEIYNIINKINPLNKKTMDITKNHNDNLMKPIGSLGKLEEISIQVSGITGKLINKIKKKAIIIMCADNGVYFENVSTTPREVTKIQALNLIKGTAGCAILSKQYNIDLKVIDIGIDAKINENNIINKKIAFGTKNCAKGEAMTKKEFKKAFMIGFELVKDLKNQKYDIIGTGEMGVSNTTTAESVISVLCKNNNLNEIVGKGAGLTEKGYTHKKNIIKKIIDVNKPDINNPCEVVQKIGGFDIAGLMGCFIGAAYFRIPIVIDGVISISAALAAYKLCSYCRDFMIPSHLSLEKGYNIAAKELNIIPLFNLEMRLGEGSGCPFAISIVESALKVSEKMCKLEDNNIDKNKLVDIRKE